MSINFFPSGIKTIATNPRMREASPDLSNRVQSELAQISTEFLAQQQAALALLTTNRTAANDDTFSGPAHIAGVTGSKGALAMLADLFANPSQNQGRGRS
jgi:hypothetical protein